ncbi:MAG: hypothetical protein JWR59_2531 [Brevundimonas sp.]|nr:hypothetical protein [Brevundimonas sp.]
MAVVAVGAFAAGKINYGSRDGMTVTVVSMSGINSAHAVIRVRHTRDDAIDFCRKYVGKVTATCIQGELETPLNDQIEGNCTTGRFSNFFGEEHQYLGANTVKKDDETPVKYLIKDIATGEIANGSSGSGYGTNMGVFRALCPSTAPYDE